MSDIQMQNHSTNLSGMLASCASALVASLVARRLAFAALLTLGFSTLLSISTVRAEEPQSLALSCVDGEPCLLDTSKLVAADNPAGSVTKWVSRLSIKDGILRFVHYPGSTIRVRVALVNSDSPPLSPVTVGENTTAGLVDTYKLEPGKYMVLPESVYKSGCSYGTAIFATCESVCHGDVTTIKQKGE